MSMREKKLLAISKFINAESARISLENKEHSIFSFFKKKSKEASFIDELTSFFNKHSKADDVNDFEKKLDELLKKYNNKDVPLKSRLTEVLNNVSPEKKNNQVKINEFDFEDFKKQMGIIFDSLNKLEKVIPIFSGKSATKRAHVMLMSIYNNINNTLKSSQVNDEQSSNIYESLQEVQEIISSTISSRLIKKSKHFEDKSKINSTLSNVYYEFSNLNQILFGQPFKKLNDNVKNVTKGNQLDKPDSADKTGLSYYINLVDSDLSKLKKYRSSDFLSIMKPSTFEHFYDNSKDKWNNAKKYFDNDKTKDKSSEVEMIFLKLVSHFKSGCEFYGTLKNVNLETKKDIEPYNKAVNILANLNNEIIEIYELLFKSKLDEKDYPKIKHVNYSEADFENAKNSNFKTVAIIFKFINAESARLELENKGRSMFSKKSSEESFIDELNNFFNKHVNDNKKFDKYLGDILFKYEKDDKCPSLVKKLRDQISGIKQSDNKEIKDFDKIEFANQLKEVDDSLKKLKKVIPLSSKVTKRTYTMLSKIYNNIKLNIEQNKDEKQKSAIIYDSLNEVKTLIPSSISSRLVKKSKRFGDESKVNKALSDVYNEFSNLNNILFDSTFEKLDSTKIDNNAKFDTSDGTDKTRVSYYINLADSDMSKLKKYRSSDFLSIMKPSTFEQFYDDSKDRWNKVKKDLDTNKIKNESLEIVFRELISHFKSGFEFYGTFEHVDLKTTEDIDKYNEAVNILVDLTNDIIEVYELLFESNSTKKTYTRIKHVNYSEIEGIHKEAYDANNIKKIEMKDKDGKTVTKYFVKRSGDHIQGKVIYSGFLFDYADVNPKDLGTHIRKSLKLDLDEKYKYLKDIFDKKILSAFDKTKAGEYGVRIIATAEGLGGKNMSSGIDDSYNIAEASVVEVSTKIISKKIKIRVYVACKALTISQMLFGKDTSKDDEDTSKLRGCVDMGFQAVKIAKSLLTIKNHISPGKLSFEPCMNRTTNKILSNFSQNHGKKAQNYSKKFDYFKECISKEQDSSLKKELEQLLKKFENSGNIAQFCIDGDRIVKKRNSKTYLQGGKSIFEEMFNLKMCLSDRAKDMLVMEKEDYKKQIQDYESKLPMLNDQLDKIAQSKSECKEKMKECEQLLAEGNEMLKKLKDENFNPTAGKSVSMPFFSAGPYDLDGVTYLAWAQKPKEEKRAEYKRLADDKIQNSGKMKDENLEKIEMLKTDKASIDIDIKKLQEEKNSIEKKLQEMENAMTTETAWKKLLGMRENKNPTPIGKKSENNNVKVDNSSVDPKSVLSGDYLLSSVPILKSDVKLPKENENEDGVVVQKESWMNPGKIWFTLSMQSDMGNSDIQKKLAEKECKNLKMKSTDALACVSDISLDIDVKGFAKMKIQLRLYISLNKTISKIAKNLVNIKLKTPKGKIELIKNT